LSAPDSSSEKPIDTGETTVKEGLWSSMKKDEEKGWRYRIIFSTLHGVKSVKNILGQSFRILTENAALIAGMTIPWNYGFLLQDGNPLSEQKRGRGVTRPGF